MLNFCFSKFKKKWRTAGTWPYVFFFDFFQRFLLVHYIKGYLWAKYEGSIKMVVDGRFLINSYRQPLFRTIANPTGIDSANNILSRKELPLPLCRDPQALFEAVLSTFLFSEESPTRKIKLNYITGLGRQNAWLTIQLFVNTRELKFY